jgi:predicted transcriptional regulator
MPKEAVFTMKLEPELRDTFMAEAAGEDRPASQVMRELMRGYIERRQQAREYDEFLHQKVKAARAQRKAGLHVSNEDVETEAAARRKELLRRAGEAGL